MNLTILASIYIGWFRLIFHLYLPCIRYLVDREGAPPKYVLHSHGCVVVKRLVAAFLFVCAHLALLMRRRFLRDVGQ